MTILIHVDDAGCCPAFVRDGRELLMEDGTAWRCVADVDDEHEALAVFNTLRRWAAALGSPLRVGIRASDEPRLTLRVQIQPVGRPSLA